MFSEHPEYRKISYSNSLRLAQAGAGNFEKNRAGNYIIPVVFHIIHNYGPENISDEQVFDAMKRINDDYNALNADLVNTIPAFDTLKANCGFEFRLAHKDPSGHCTNGIDRIVSYKTYGADDQSKLNIWNPSRYLNIWVVNSIGKQGAAAYAYKPPTADIIFYWDGILCLFDYVGASGASTPSHQHTLSHEIGHYLNLDHPWGGTNEPGVACGDDGVGDTPNTRGFSNCLDLFAAICEPGRIENVQNFMEYSYCSTMFTIGQKYRMETSLNSLIAQRKFLFDPIAHAYTGCLLPKPDCPPTAQFRSNRQFVCIGNPIQLSATSWGDSLISHEWSTSSDGSFSAPTANSTQYIPSSTGWKNIKLEASSNAGSSSKEEIDYVFVADPLGRNPQGQVESFVHASDRQQWPIFNYAGNSFAWKFSSATGLWGNECLMFQGFDKRTFPASTTLSARGDWDDIMTPAFDLTGLSPTNAYLSFWRASASRAAINLDMDDSLVISYSTNCGSSWIRLKSFSGIELHNNGSYSSIEFTPTQVSQWSPLNVKLAGSALTASTFFRLRFYAGDHSNNTYVDNFSFGSAPVGLSEYGPYDGHVSIFPNPSNGHFRIVSNYLGIRQPVVIRLVNSLGQMTFQKVLETNDKGKVDESLDFDDRNPAGIYFLQVQHGESVQTIKVVIQ